LSVPIALPFSVTFDLPAESTLAISVPRSWVVFFTAEPMGSTLVVGLPAFAFGP